MGWSRSLTRSFARALCAQCPAAGGACTQAPPAGGRRWRPGEQRGQCPLWLRPSLCPLWRPWRLPRWDAPHHLPAPPAPSGGGRFCSIMGGVGGRLGAFIAGSLFAPFQRVLLLACAMESGLRDPSPTFPLSTSDLEREWAYWWPQRHQCHQGASLFLGWELGTHLPTVSWLGSEWG